MLELLGWHLWVFLLVNVEVDGEGGRDAVLPCEFLMRQINREPGDESVLLRMAPQWHRRMVESGCGPGVDGSRKELRILVSFARVEGDVGHSSGARPGGMPGELGDRCRWHLARLELRQQMPPQATPIVAANAWGGWGQDHRWRFANPLQARRAMPYGGNS